MLTGFIQRYMVFSSGSTKSTKGFSPDNLTCINIQSNVFMKRCMRKVSKSVRVYVYIFLQARSSIVGDSASGWSGHSASFGADTERYQSVLEHYISKIEGIYMLPSNLNLIIRKSVGQNNKILISNINMKIGSNRT